MKKKNPKPEVIGIKSRSKREVQKDLHGSETLQNSAPV